MGAIHCAALVFQNRIISLPATVSRVLRAVLYSLILAQARYFPEFLGLRDDYTLLGFDGFAVVGQLMIVHHASRALFSDTRPSIINYCIVELGMQTFRGHYDIDWQLLS